MNAPLMPKATAVWLISNTSLTFDQIAEFCKLHPLEIQGIADGDVAIGIVGEDPIINGQLTKENIKECEQNPEAKLKLIEVVSIAKPTKKYIPVARRQDKPDAILWILKKYPDMKESQIIKLLGTTKNTVLSIKNREHWNTPNVRPRDPVLLGLCSQVALNKAVETLNKQREAQQDTPNLDEQSQPPKK